MRGEIDKNTILMNQCINETKKRIIQTEGISKRLQIAEIKIEVIDQNKLKEAIYYEKMKNIDHSLRSLDHKWRG